MKPLKTLLAEIEKETIRGVSLEKYSSIHYWLRKNYGRADKCESVDCLGKSNRFSWSLRQGLKYEYNRENFWQLCYSCHGKYDSTEEGRKKMRALRKGKMALTNREKNCSICDIELPTPRHSSIKYCEPCSIENNKLLKKRWEEEHRDRMRELHRKWARKRFGCKVSVKYAHEAQSLEYEIS